VSNGAKGTGASSDGAGAGGQRRHTHIEHAVTYAAVGASGSADLLRFPPEGSTPFEFELRLGSGSERFLIASSSLMTWGAQRGVGIRVKDIEHGDGGQYRGVEFDENGTPLPAADAEQQFGPDGEPYVSANTSVTLHWPDQRPSRRYRVVYTVDEPRRIGYAWGTADEQGVVGEELFTVEHRDDDTVWAAVRGFLWAPEGGLLPKTKIKQALKESQAQIGALVTGVLPTGD